MALPVTFHHPRFDENNIKDKIGICLRVDSAHSVSQINEEPVKGRHAIASDGIDSNINGTHVFVTRIDNIGDASIRIGWTGNATWDSATFSVPGFVLRDGMSGFVLNLRTGNVMGRGLYTSALSPNITKKAKEVVSVLQMSENGRKKVAGFIVDGHRGKAHDVTNCFENKNECFPIMVVNAGVGAKVTTIPFSELKSTSPIIEELKKKSNHHPPLLPPSMNNNEENEKLIAELRREVDEGNRRLLEQKDEQIEEMKIMFRQQLEMKDRQLADKDGQMKAQLEMKDRQMKEQLEIKDQQLSQHLMSNEKMLQRSADEKKQVEKQLELERAEHQKTRNLLHQKTTEMKDMEIHFLKQYIQNGVKESGQRRERQNDEFEVKKERED